MDIVQSIYYYWGYYYLPRAPVAPVWLLGIVLASLFRRRHRQASWAAGGAFLGFLGVSLVTTGFQYWIQSGESREDVRSAIGAAEIVLPIITLAAWLLLLAAIFLWRSAGSEVESSTSPLPDSWTITRASLVGALVGGILMLLLLYQTPFHLELFQTPGPVLVQLAASLGALVAALAVITSGAARAAILGATTGIVGVHCWSAITDDPENAKAILRVGPYAGLLGLLLGACIGWARRGRPNKR